MPEWAEFIGAIVRWIFKGFSSSIKDEIEGNYDSSWGGSYEFENFIIGIISIIIVLSIIIYFGLF